MICTPCANERHSQCEGDMARFCTCSTCVAWSAAEGPFADACPDFWTPALPPSGKNP